MKSASPPIANIKRIVRRERATLLALVMTLTASPGLAETSAGDHIINIASLTARQEGRVIGARSNAVDLVTAERLDLTLILVANQGGPAVVVLTNSGNGIERFTIGATVTNADVTVRGIAIDRDGDGRYDPAVDVLLTGPTPPLAPGAALRLLVLLDSPVPATTSLTITAAAVTASGTPGTIAPGAGDGGGDAVVGPTGARASVTLDALSPSPGGGSIGAGTGGASLAKSQAVRAPDGSATAVRDAIVTYTLVARFTAAATAARVDDPIPAGTAYVPGSLSLDGGALSDVADGDAGTGDARAIGVALGDVAGGTVRTIQFQVRIQ